MKAWNEFLSSVKEKGIQGSLRTYEDGGVWKITMPDGKTYGKGFRFDPKDIEAYADQFAREASNTVQMLEEGNYPFFKQSV